jgi:4'-phosphopantetheinyl transferase
VIVDEDDGIEVVATALSATRGGLAACTAVLSPPERMRASRFIFARDQRRFIVRRAGLRRLLGERLGLPPASIDLSIGKHGKPALAPPLSDADLHFSVSSSHDLAVFAFAWGKEVGVDVEAIGPVDAPDRAAPAAFSPAELAEYRSLPPQDRRRGFINCWTRKEAFVKATGRGLLCPLDSFDVSLSPRQPARILRVGRTDGERCGWHLRCCVPAPGFVAAVVSGGA